MRRTLLLVLGFAAALAVVVVVATRGHDAPAPLERPSVEPSARDTGSKRAAADEPLEDARVAAPASRAPEPSIDRTPAAKPISSVARDILGRCVDEHHASLPTSEMLCGFADVPLDAAFGPVEAAALAQQPLMLDDDGRFHAVEPGPPSAATKRVLVLRWALALTLERRSAERRTAIVEIPADASSPIDLGDVVFALDPLLVSGLVVDLSDKPVDQAQVRVEIPAGVDGTGERVRDRFLVALSDVHGAFQIFGRSPRRVDVLTWASGRNGERLDGIEPGTTDLKLRVDARLGGKIEGSILCDANLPAGAFELVIPSMFFVRRCPITDAGGAIHVANVEPGLVDLEIGLVSSAFTVARIERVRIKAFETADDPRLASIDVRGKVAKLAAFILKPDGQPLVNYRVEVVGTDGRRSNPSTDDRGRLEVLLPAGTKRAPLQVPGYRGTALVDGATIRLEPY